MSLRDKILSWILLLHWISGNDHEQLDGRVRLHDDFPRVLVVANLNDPTTLDNVWTKSGCMLEHPPEIDFGETAIHHPLEKMRTKLKFPLPPLWPSLAGQRRPPANQEAFAK